MASAPLSMAATAGRVPVYTDTSQKWNGNNPSLMLNAMKKSAAAIRVGVSADSRSNWAMPSISSRPVIE